MQEVSDKAQVLGFNAGKRHCYLCAQSRGVVFPVCSSCSQLLSSRAEIKSMLFILMFLLAGQSHFYSKFISETD